MRTFTLRNLALKSLVLAVTMTGVLASRRAQRSYFHVQAQGCHGLFDERVQFPDLEVGKDMVFFTSAIRSEATEERIEYRLESVGNRDTNNKKIKGNKYLPNGNKIPSRYRKGTVARIKYRRRAPKNNFCTKCRCYRAYGRCEIHGSTLSEEPYRQVMWATLKKGDRKKFEGVPVSKLVEQCTWHWITCKDENPFNGDEENINRYNKYEVQSMSGVDFVAKDFKETGKQSESDLSVSDEIPERTEMSGQADSDQKENESSNAFVDITRVTVAIPDLPSSKKNTHAQQPRKNTEEKKHAFSNNELLKRQNTPIFLDEASPDMAEIPDLPTPTQQPQSQVVGLGWTFNEQDSPAEDDESEENDYSSDCTEVLRRRRLLERLQGI